jgi:hypothetical protein
MEDIQAPQHLRHASLTHVRLINNFIQMVNTEMDRQDCSFVRESLTEMLENLLSERHNYALVSGIRVVEPAA